jgi:chromosome segregation ATPase
MNEMGNNNAANNATASTDKIAEFQEMKAQLAETQRSLAVLLVERNSIQRERDELKERLSRDQLEQASNSEKDCYQIQELEERLKLFEKENQQLRLENQDLQETFNVSQKSATLEASVTAEDLQKENDRLQRQVMERERQIEDWKLLIPRNKLLLQQAHQKSEKLQKQMKEIEEKYQEQEDFIKEIQLTKEALVKQKERHQSEFDQLKVEKETMEISYEETREVLKSLDLDDINSEGNREERERLIKFRDAKPTVTSLSSEEDDVENCQFTHMLPSDLPSDEMHGKKHVIEWDWSGDNLTGVYTGWLDLEGNPHGQGTLRIDDGAIHVGEWQHGKRHGMNE